jgi:hypothetical protein
MEGIKSRVQASNSGGSDFKVGMARSDSSLLLLLTDEVFGLGYRTPQPFNPFCLIEHKHRHNTCYRLFVGIREREPTIGFDVTVIFYLSFRSLALIHPI